MSNEHKQHPGLLRAQLACKIGQDVLDGKTSLPDRVTPMEYAMYNLLHAVEEIAAAMMQNVQGHVLTRSEAEGQ